MSLFTGAARWVIWMIVIAAFGGIGGACASTRSAENPPGPHLRVLTYNLYKNSPAPQAAIDVIRDANADVVCVQEASDDWIYLLRRELSEDYRYQAFNDPVHGFDGIGVISRWPIVRGQVLNPAPGGWFPSLLCSVESPIGLVQVLNVHLHPPVSDSGSAMVGYLTTSGNRSAEIRHLLPQLDTSVPRIVLGDFNETDSGSAIRRLRRNGYLNALQQFDRKTPTWRGNYGAMKLSSRPDHILYSKDLHAFDANVIFEAASDHDPILAIIGRK